MVELADTQVLGTCAVRRGGSTPSKGTILKEKEMKFVIILYYCLSTNCYTVVYPELYWGRKDCSAAATEIKNQYRTLEEIDKPREDTGPSSISDLLGLKH